MSNRRGHPHFAYEVFRFDGRDFTEAREVRAMALANRPATQQRPVRRIWKTPGSKWNWIFLATSLVIVGSVYLVTRNAVAAHIDPDPNNTPFRQFGVVAFVLVLVVASYSLRRRFIRRLPGKVEGWLWLHVWVGVVSVLVAFIHENLLNITYDFEW